MTLAEFKALTRQVFKVAPGGPTDRTRGRTVIDLMDVLAEQAFAEMGGGEDATFDITPTNSLLGIQAGQLYENVTAAGLFRTMLVLYQAPAVVGLELEDEGSRTVLVGTPFAGGNKTVTWTIANGGQVQANSLKFEDLTAAQTLLTGQANDGTATANTAAFAVTKGESRRYRLTGTNDRGEQFSGDLVINGLFNSYFGYATSKTLSMADLIALGNPVLQNGHVRTVYNVTAAQHLYTVYAWEDNGGTDDVEFVFMDGVDTIRGAFGPVQRVTGPNEMGATVTMSYIVSNSNGAFGNNFLEFR